MEARWCGVVGVETTPLYAIDLFIYIGQLHAIIFPNIMGLWNRDTVSGFKWGGVKNPTVQNIIYTMSYQSNLFAYRGHHL